MNNKPLKYAVKINGRITLNQKEKFDNIMLNYDFTQSGTLRYLLDIAFKNINETVDITNHDVDIIKNSVKLTKTEKLLLEYTDQIIELKNQNKSFRDIQNILNTEVSHATIQRFYDN